MKYFLAVAVVALSLCTQPAKADPQTERIRKAAEENRAAAATGNYARVVDLTYPKLVEMVGGRDKMIEALRRAAEGLKAAGSAILRIDVDEPKEVVTSGDKQFAIVPMTVTAQLPQGTVRAKSFLVAISADHGDTWRFIDGAGRTKENLAKVLPDFPPQLSLPSSEPPVLEPK